MFTILLNQKRNENCWKNNYSKNLKCSDTPLGYGVFYFPNYYILTDIYNENSVLYGISVEDFFKEVPIDRDSKNKLSFKIL